MNNTVFRKTMENVRNHRDIRLVRTNKKRSKLVSEPNYNKQNGFQGILINTNEENKSKN